MTIVNRRQFLGQSLAAGAALTALPALSGKAFAAEKPGSKMRLGLVTYLWGKDWDLPTLIANCEASKILAVELRTTHAHGVEPSLSAKERAEVKKRFEDSAMEWAGIGSNECYDSPSPRKLERSIKATKEFLQLSHDIGGTGVKVKPNDFHEGVDHEKTIEQIGKSLNTLGAFAADLGQEIRLEVHGKCCELPTIKAIMDVATHKSVGVCWNSNDQDLHGEGLEYNFNLVKERFGNTVHVRELNIGDYPYQQLMDLFVAMNYGGWVLVGTRTHPKDRVAALQKEYQGFPAHVCKAQAKPE